MYMAKSVTKSVLQNVERSMTDDKSEGPKTLLEILCRESAPMLEIYALCRESRRHLHMGSHWKNPQAKFSGSAAVAVPGSVLASDLLPNWTFQQISTNVDSLDANGLRFL